MAEADNPFTHIQDKVLKVRTRLFDFLRNVLAKIRPIMRIFVRFMSEVGKVAKELGQAVGEPVVRSILSASRQLPKIVTFVEKLVLRGIKLADRILAVIRKSLSVPEKAFKIVKAMVARLAKLFRMIGSQVLRVLALLDPIDVALSMINAMKKMLQAMFKWVGQVGSLASGVKRVKNLIQKFSKLLKAEAKNVTEMVKQANKLKPA